MGVERESQSVDRGVHYRSLLVGLSAGLIAGAAIGLLYAPKKGKYVRAEIGRRVGKTKDDVSEYVGNAWGKAASAVHSLRQTAGTA